MNPIAARRVRQALAAATLASSLVLAGCSDSPESLITKAKESLAKNEPKAAEIHLKNLLQKNDNAEGRYLLGTVYLQSGDLRSAEKELTRARDAGFDAARVAAPLADTQLQLGQAKEALETAAKASPTDPADKARLATIVGRAHLALGKRDEAKASFEAALAAVPEHAAAQVGLATLQAAGGDLAGASAAVDRTLAKSPASNEALALKGDLELAQGRAKEAREWFAKAAVAAPRDVMSRAKGVSLAIQSKEFDAAQKTLDEMKNLTGPAPLTMQLQAQLHAAQGKLEPARDAIQVALKNGPDYLPAMALGAEIYLQLGAAEQAERLARQIVERVPNAMQGHRLLAMSQMRMNAPDKAMQTLQPWLDRNVADPSLYALAGEAALRANDAARSAAYFERAIQLDPSDPRKKTGLAFAHLAAGQQERGIAELERVSALPDSGSQADLALIATHLRNRQFDKALAAIDQLEKKEPNGAMAPNLRGTALLGKGDAAGARKAFEQALSRDPKSLGATTNLANLDLRDKKPADAKKRFTTLLEKDPKNIQAMLAIAELIQRTAPKDDKKAREEIPVWLKKAYDTDKTATPAVLALAGWYVGNNQAKDAIPMLQEALATKPDDIQLLDALGTAYLRSDQETLGMETLEKILRAKPDNAALQMRMGQFKLSRNDTTGALANFRRAAELQPKAVEPKVAIAAVLARTGKVDEARAVATALQKEQPANPAGPLLEGDIAMSQRKFPEAAAAYRKALASARALPKATAAAQLPIHIKLHQATLGAGNLSEADGMLRSMVKDAPDNLALRNYAAEHEIARRRWAEAIAHYQVVVEKQPNNPLALNNMAWAMHEAKDPKALETAEKALALAPKAPAVLDTVGVILVAAGKADRGIDLMRQAVSIDPKAPALRLHLAEALIGKGDAGSARKEIDAVLAANPDGPAAQSARELIKRLERPGN